MMTHGPPFGILDATRTGEKVGCVHLLRAARRCKPRLHCFGHIHEGWGAQKLRWKEGDDLDVRVEEHVESVADIEPDEEKMLEQRAVDVDIGSGSATAVEFGKETLMVNASIMTVSYRPWNAPWLIDMDLEMATNS